MTITIIPAYKCLKYLACKGWFTLEHLWLYVNISKHKCERAITYSYLLFYFTTYENDNFSLREGTRISKKL